MWPSNEFSARLATFTQTKKKGAATISWPHEFPSPEGLARAGFYYKPAADSEDNVQCFMCNVKLDGWEPADDPISEHLAHSDSCAWATSISVIRDEDSQQAPEQRDPLSEEMAAARHATFQSGNGWPHEGKKGWKCKISKMVDAGWAWDPNDESEDRDGVTCFYCNLSLDGWEPKDDPFVEHKRREPGCQFFTLMEHYHGKAKKGKKNSSMGGKTEVAKTTKVKKKVQAEESAEESAEDKPKRTAKGRKVSSMGSRSKAAAKGAKGKKKAPVVEIVEDGISSIGDKSDVAMEEAQGGNEIAVEESAYESAEERPEEVAAKGRKTLSISSIGAKSDVAAEEAQGTNDQAKEESAEGIFSIEAKPDLAEEEAKDTHDQAEEEAKGTSDQAEEESAEGISSIGTKPDLAVEEAKETNDQAEEESVIIVRKSLKRKSDEMEPATQRSAKKARASMAQEIEEEFDRIANEAASQDAMDYETSPSTQRLSNGSKEKEHEEEAEQMEIDSIAESSPGSNKENERTTQVPIAPGTPTRKTHLASTVPWDPIDLDTIFLTSPNAIGAQLAEAAGILTSEEKAMSVEEWVRFRAAQAEEALRKRCEEAVSAFEKEGMRALASLNGMIVVG